MKPEFWKDRQVATLPPTTRLTYIGLWMLADDDGWFRYDPPLIALELYGWESVDQRETAVDIALGELVERGRVVVSACGKHAVIPKLVDHQRFSGETKKVHTFKREHENCPRIPAGIPPVPVTSPQVPATERVERNVSERSVSLDARKREDDGEMSDFQRLVDRKVALG